MILFLISFLIFLLFLSAFLSASETALFSLSPLTIRSYKTSPEKRLQLISHLMEHPRNVLVTILILNVLSNILVQNTVSSLFDAFPHWILKVGLPLLLTLLLGEVIPKSIAMPNNISFAYRVSPWIDWAAKILKPIREPLTRATSWISRFLFFFLHKEEEISEEELRHVVESSLTSKVLLPQEGRLIQGALDLQSSLVKERMRPREEMFSYDIQESLQHLTHLLVDLEISRVPVYKDSLENLLGVISAKEFFFHQDQIHGPQDLISFLKKPYYTPESTKAWVLLKTLRERGEGLAIVIDEYGSISGLVTQEDLMESVVGEIADRRDEKSLYTRSSDDAIIASGKLELSEFKEIFHIPLKSKENILTLGGWLIEQLGEIPSVGTKYANDQFLFYILEAEPNRIRRVYVRKLKTIKKK
jgi:putative hemolysin